jgi:hypothetical protein
MFQTKTMYLVAFKLRKRNPRGGLIYQMCNALLGPVVHCELAFVQGFDCDALVITARCPKGLPIYYLHRLYDDHDGKYDIVWYKFNTVMYQDICACQTRAKAICKEEKHKLSMYEMMGSTLPRAFRVFYEYGIALLFGELEYVMEYDEPVTHLFCVTLLLLCFAPLFPDVLAPANEVDHTYNSSELFARLLNAKLIEKCDAVPVEPKQKQEKYLDMLQNSLYAMTKKMQVVVSKPDDYIY